MSDFDSSDIVDQIAEEILEQVRLGEKPSLDDYAERYPEVESELRELFPSLLLMEHFGSPDVSGGLPVGETTTTGKRKLGDYVIIREVGRGGMGIVYEAEEEPLGRRVAIKVLSSRLRYNANQVKRFDREARSVARLEHPGIVPVYRVGSDRGVPFYVMKFINGKGLDEVLTELRRFGGLEADFKHLEKTGHELSDITYALAGGISQGNGANENQTIESGSAGKAGLDNFRNESSESDSSSSVFARLSSSDPASRRAYHQTVVRIGVHVVRALHYAHEQGVLHRDIKPSNLMLDLFGHVWLTDFGLAKIRHEEDITNTGEFVGTLRYTSPEQLRGWSDPRSDVYSLGITLYEMLTLQPAFPDADRSRLLARIAHDDPTPIRKIDPQIPRNLANIVQKSIAKEPSQRYGSALEFAEDLQRFLDDKPVHARRVMLHQHIRLWARRKPAVAALSSLLLISLIAALLIVCRFWRQSESDKMVAMRASDEARRALENAESARIKAEATSQTLAEMILAGHSGRSGNYSVHQMLLDYEDRLGENLGDFPHLEAKLRHAIAAVFHNRNQLSHAKTNLTEALRLFEESGDAESLEAAGSHVLLANVYRLMRDNNAGAQHLESAMEIREKKLGADHPDTLQSRVFWLAALREVSPRQLSNEQILEELDKVAQSLRDRLDEEHCAEIFLHARFYAITATNRLGRYQQGETYCRERLEIQQRLYKDRPNHPAIIYTMQQQAEIKRLQRDFAESVKILRDAQDRSRKWFDGEPSAQEIDMLIEESKTHLASGDHQAMHSSARRAFDLAREHLPPENPLVSDSATFLSQALTQLGRDSEAKQIRSEFGAE